MRQPRRVSRHLARQPFGTRRAARCPSLRTRQGPLPVPHDTSRHDLVPATPVKPGRRGVPPAPRRPPWPSVVRFPPARYHEVGVPVPLRCVDRLRCCFAARHWRSFNLPLSHAGLFVPATSPVATTVCGAPYHRVITLAPTIVLAKPLARLAARPIWRPVTTAFAPDRSSARPGSDGAPASFCAPSRSPHRPRDEHHHGADRRLVGAGYLHVRPAGVRRPQDAPAALDGHRPHQRRAAGTVHPHRHMRAVGRRLVAIDVHEADRGRDDAIAASARTAEARCVAAMPTNQLRTSFAPMTSTRRAPWPPPAGLRHRNRSR